ncbi:MAG: PEP-CTERM sorting domain-containing protein [Verrucomicrobiota bacterium]
MSDSALAGFAVNGALFRTSLDTVTVSGTGVYNTFLAFGDDPGDGDLSVEGFNSGSNSLMPEVNDAKTFALLGSSLTTVQNLLDPSAVLYGFGADINEPASQGRAFISVDQLQIWVRPAAAGDIDPANTYSALSTATGAVKVWDLDAGGDKSVLFNYLLASSGSGRSDLLFILPESVIQASVPTFAPDANWSVYLFARMGDTGTSFDVTRDYGENGGGFEEWQTVGNLVLLPEPGTYAAIGVVGLAAVGVWRRSRRSKA